MDNFGKRVVEEGLEPFSLYYSRYRALVVDNNDVDKLGRLELILPNYDPVKPLPNWAWPVNMQGSKNYGSYNIPRKGDIVWVSFEGGRLANPIWEHCGYGVDQLPKEFKTVNHKGFKTPRGTLLLINDNKDEEEILVKLNSTVDWVKITKDEIETESKLIKLGKDKEEHALMGDTTKAKLESFMDKVMDFMQQYIEHTHNTPFGPTSPPILAAQTTATKTQLETLKGELEEILSQKVYIDKGDDSNT